jgi:tetratricopeptide (TPR) repeat protein
LSGARTDWYGVPSGRVYTKGVAAKAEIFRVCPKCGARNKGKWEFCVRCGESLQDVTVATSQAKPEIVPVEESPEASPIGWVLLAIVFLAVAGGSVWWWSRTPVPAPVKTSAMAMVPPQIAPPSPSPGTNEGPADQLVGLARSKLAQNDLPGALAALEQALDKDPGNASIHALYGHVELLSGNLAKAVSAYTRATELDPQSAFYRAGRAGALNLAGRYDEAIPEYQRITAQGGEPTIEEAYGELLLFKKNDPAAALPHLKRASEGRPEDLGYTEQLASALEQTHDVEGATKLYRSVLEKSPGAAESRGRLAEILFTQGKTDDAINLTRAGIQQNPSVPVLHRDLGSFLERAGRLLEASAAYGDYARLAPNAPDAGTIKERADALAQQAQSP